MCNDSAPALTAERRRKTEVDTAMVLKCCARNFTNGVCIVVITMSL